MCNECTQLRASHSETAERLLEAQRELARYDLANSERYLTVWNECETRLKTLWRIREELAAHRCPSSDGAWSAAF